MTDRELFVEIGINTVKKIIPRGGQIFRSILEKPENIITGAEALTLYNIYAVTEGGLALLEAITGKEIEWEDFFNLLWEQKEESKKARLC